MQVTDLNKLFRVTDEAFKYCKDFIQRAEGFVDYIYGNESGLYVKEADKSLNISNMNSTCNSDYASNLFFVFR